MKNIFSKDSLRAIRKIPAAIYVFAGALGSTAYLSIKKNVAGSERSTRLRDHFIKAAANVMTTKVDISPNSAPITDKVAMFTVHHTNRMDLSIIPKFPQADFMMTAHFFKTPAIGQIIKKGAEAAGFIGTEQTKEGKKRDLGQVIDRLNNGTSICYFPAGVCTAHELVEWSKGSVEPLYGESGVDISGNEVYLERKEIVIQPIALRVKEINGENVLNSPEKWGKATMILDKRNMLSRIWSRMKLESITLEMQVLPPLLPEHFNSAADLMNEAHDQVRAIVNPDQIGTRKRRQFLEWHEDQPHQEY